MDAESWNVCTAAGTGMAGREVEGECKANGDFGGEGVEYE